MTALSYVKFDERMISVVPFGTDATFLLIPNVEMLGYFQMSLRDKLGLAGRKTENQRNRKQSAAIRVGTAAPAKSPIGRIESLKNRLSKDAPAGFGAFAITVRPPPTTAPATTAYFSCSVSVG